MCFTLLFPHPERFINAAAVSLLGRGKQNTSTSPLVPLRATESLLKRVQRRSCLINHVVRVHCRAEQLRLTVSFLFETMIKYKHH